DGGRADPEWQEGAHLSRVGRGSGRRQIRADAPVRVGQEVAPPKLALAGVTKRFGGLRAVGACSFEIVPGTVVGLIGPNGSGKSTLFDLITGLQQPDEGAVFHDGHRIDGLATHEIARRGIGRTFQSVKLFRELPVRENLAIAAMGRGLDGWEGRAAEWLEGLGLTRPVDAPPRRP